MKNIKIYSNKSINKYKNKINLLGKDNNFISIEKFLNIRILSSLILFFMLIYLSEWGYILSPIITIVYFYLYPNIFLDSKINIRKEELEEESILFFETLLLSLETGKNLKQSLELTVSIVDSKISKEFSNALKAVEYGKSLDEALNDLINHIPSISINNIISNLAQSNNYGTDITKTIDNQINYLRHKKLMEIKSKINKMPIKISVVSVLFFIPMILLLILSPVLLEFLTR